MADRINPKQFDRVLKKYLPKDWTISYLPIPEMDAIGCAYDNIIYIPERHQLRILLIFLHEVAHIKKRHVMETLKPYWVKEYECERWAITTARKEGITVPEWHVNRSKEYVRVRYRYYLKICEVYKVTCSWDATPGQLNWMELDR